MDKAAQKTGRILRRAGHFAAPAVLCLSCVFTAAVFVVLRIRMETAVRALLFYPAGLLLPGYLLARSAADRDSAGELYGFSLLFGAGFAVLAYFLDAFIRMPVFPGRFFSCFLGPALSIPAVFLLLRDVKTGKRDRKSLKPDIRLLAVAAAAAAISLGSCALLSAVPADSVDVIEQPHIDVVWNIGNMASLSHGWPADNMQYLGKLFNRHCFASIFRVAAGRFIGAGTQAEMMYVFSCLYLLPLLVFALDSLGRSLMDGNGKRSLLFVLVFLFIGFASRAFLFFYNAGQALEAAEAAGLSNGNAKQLFGPNGIDLAVPGCALLILLVRKHCLREGKLSPGLWAATAAAAAVVTGAKYVSAVCVLGGIVGAALFQLLQKRGIRTAAKNLIPLLLITAGFVPVFFGVVKGGKIYLPPTQQEAAWYTSSDEAYPEARDAYTAQLMDNSLAFLVVRGPQGPGEPVVRQMDDGVFYVCGREMSKKKITPETARGLLLQAEDLRTDGLLGGAGGVWHADEGQDTLFTISRAKDFVRFTDRATGERVVLFYTAKTSLSSERLKIRVLNQPGMTAPGMFMENGDGTEMDYSHQYSAFSINALMKNSEVYEALRNLAGITGEGRRAALLLLLLIPIHFVLMRPLTAVPFLCWMGGRLKRFRTVGPEDFAAGGAAVCGLLAYYFLDIDGGSQRYFLDTAVLMVDAAGVCWLCGHYRGLRKPVRILVCCAAVIGLCTNWGFYGGRLSAGIEKARASVSDAPVSDTEPGWHITRYEMEAMAWLRENTPEDAVAATNRHYANTNAIRSLQPEPNDQSRYFYYAAYGERQMFLGSWAYLPRTPRMQEMLRQRLVVNDALFDPMCRNRREIMEANGISCLIASAEAGTGMDLREEGLDCVFRNRDIAIYMPAGRIPDSGGS